MKTPIYLHATAATLLLFLACTQLVCAFYDPAVQRWIQRDPADDWESIVDHLQDVHESRSDSHLYRFVLNVPTSYDDSFGLIWVANKPTDGNSDTIVCDGKGGIRPYLTPASQSCLCQPAKDCRIAHENSHVQDALKAQSDICKNKADRTQVWIVLSTKQLNDTEKKA